MRIGFTGTQRGMTDRQKAEVRGILTAIAQDATDTELHHGDCVGADAEADEIARSLGITVVIHPPDNPAKRAYTARSGDEVWAAAPYLERNRDIVDATHLLIATPRGATEELRSGT